MLYRDAQISSKRVEVKDVRLPYNLQRAMAAEAEASREAKAKVRFQREVFSRISLNGKFCHAKLR